MEMSDLVQEKINNAFIVDNDYKLFCGKDNLKTLTREDVVNYQLYRFKKMMSFSIKNSDFYKALYAKSDLPNCLEDISKLPFTFADDLRVSPYDMLCIGLSDIATTFSHTTTGTTSGVPKRIYFSKYDAEQIVISMSAVIQTVFGEDVNGKKVHIFLPKNGGEFSIAGLISSSVERLGGIPKIGNCFDNTENQIASIKSFKPDMIMGSAFRIWRITQEAKNYHTLNQLGVNKIFITSEYLSDPMRNFMETWWHAKVFHHYGMSEPGFVIGIECEAHEGFHYNESDLYFEIIDPITGQVVEDDNYEGELVLTTLNRTAMPLIRYRTGDIARITREKCSCGTEILVRIGKLPKRQGMDVIIGGNEVIYSSLFDEALHQFENLVDYRIFIHDQSGKDVLECVSEVLGQPTHEVEAELLRLLKTIPAINRCLNAGTLKIKFSYAKWGELRRGGTSQKRRIKDTREVRIR